METIIMKVVCGIIISSVIFAEKVPTAKKQDEKVFLIFIIVIIAVCFVGYQTGGIVID